MVQLVTKENSQIGLELNNMSVVRHTTRSTCSGEPMGGDDCRYAENEFVKRHVVKFCSVNYPARAFGIKRGERVEEVIKKCPACHIIHVETIGDSATDPANCKVHASNFHTSKHVWIITISFRPLSNHIA